MALTRIDMKNGASVTVKHQFGTVRTYLSNAKLQTPAEKTGYISPYAEFRIHPDGERMGINPEEVVAWTEVKE